MLTSHCVRCDYALAGLPRDGRCPECGTAIDDRFVVLRGHVIGRSANAGNARPWMVPVVLLGASGALIGQIPSLILSRSVRETLSSAAAILVLSTPSLMMVWRRLNLDGPPAQLWLGPAGYWQRDRVALLRASTARRLASSVLALFGVGLVMIAFWYSPWLGVFVTPPLAALAAVLWILARRDAEDEIDVETAAFGRQRFTRWERVEAVFVSPRPDGRATLTIRPTERSFWTVRKNVKLTMLFEPSVGPPLATEAEIQRWIAAARKSREARIIGFTS